MKKQYFTVGGAKVDKPKTLPENFAVKVHSQEHYEAVVKRVYDMGLSWEEETAEEFCQNDTFEESEVEYVVGKGEVVRIVADETSECTRLAWSGYPVLTLDDLYTLGKSVRKVVLNDEYTAIIEDDHVKVGCQEIPFDKIEELYKLIKKYYS